MHDVIKIEGATVYQVKLNNNYNVHVLILVRNMAELEIKKQEINNHPDVIGSLANIWTRMESYPDNLSIFCS